MVSGELNDHLFLLNRVEPSLPDVVRRLPKPLINLWAKGVSSSLLDAVGLDKPCLHQPLQNLTGGDLVTLDFTGETARLDPALVA